MTEIDSVWYKYTKLAFARELLQRGRLRVSTLGEMHGLEGGRGDRFEGRITTRVADKVVDRHSSQNIKDAVSGLIGNWAVSGTNRFFDCSFTHTHTCNGFVFCATYRRDDRVLHSLNDKNADPYDCVIEIQGPRRFFSGVVTPALRRAIGTDIEMPRMGHVRYKGVVENGMMCVHPNDLVHSNKVYMYKTDKLDVQTEVRCCWESATRESWKPTFLDLPLRQTRRHCHLTDLSGRPLKY